MITLKPIQSNSGSYPFVEELYVESFPTEERRDILEQRRYIDQNPLMHCCMIYDEMKPIGFITYWLFDNNLCYVEHFAINPILRNKGYGEKALKTLADQVKCPIVLEVEKPGDEISRRRIGFYQRIGFKLWENSKYEQPPYPPQKEKVPMMLMAYGDLHEEIHFSAIKDLLYKEVYSYSEA